MSIGAEKNFVMASSQLFMNIHDPLHISESFFLTLTSSSKPKNPSIFCHFCAASGFPFPFLPITVPIHYFFFALLWFRLHMQICLSYSVFLCVSACFCVCGCNSCLGLIASLGLKRSYRLCMVSFAEVKCEK